MHDLAEDRRNEFPLLREKCYPVAHKLRGKNMVRHFFNRHHPALNRRTKQHLRQIAKQQLVDLLPDQLGIGPEHDLDIPSAQLNDARRAKSLQCPGVDIPVIVHC
ncbi:hypothetical protein D3C74_411100 [compost metagenome]